MSDPLKRMLNEIVVLDTETPIIYIGKLVEVTDRVFVLEDTDMERRKFFLQNERSFLPMRTLPGARYVLHPRPAHQHHPVRIIWYHAKVTPIFLPGKSSRVKQRRKLLSP